MERSDPTAWETRFDWTLTALMFGAFGLAIFLSGLSSADRENGFWAAIIAGVYVVVLQAIPRRVREQRLTGEVLATLGVIATLAAVALTSAGNGGYVLLVAVPIFFASAFMGFRVGMETALLATAGLVGILVVLELPILDRATTIVLYLLIGFTFSQARRLLVIEMALADELRAASALDAARVERLESAHGLLVELAELAGTAELSAVNIAESALTDLAAAVPIAAGSVTGPDHEPVARWGSVPVGEDASDYAIAIGERQLGCLTLWPLPSESLQPHEATIEATAAGVALAYDNIQLLQTVARRSIQDERNRVARELHDDIGPQLASLGLSLDILVSSAPTTRSKTQLRKLRSMVTDLVERVRSTVAALRRQDTTTVVEHVRGVAGELGVGPPHIVVDVEERRPADGAVAAEVGAIVIEAVRNAARHAEASRITVEGYVDSSHGAISVVDDGKGFNANADYPGHFGLVGMRERAAAIDGAVTIESVLGRGSALRVVWGTPSSDTPS